MSDPIRLRDRTLAYIHNVTETGQESEFVIEARDLGSLEALLRLEEDEVVEIPGIGCLSYREFRNDLLSRTKRIYPSGSDYISDRHKRETSAPAGNVPNL